MTTERIEEFLISPALTTDIQHLLQLCFPQYPPLRIYHKQVPTFRLLVWNAPTELTAHAGIIFRMIQIEDKPLRLFGISDFCVHPNARHRKIGTELLQNIERLALQNQIDLLLLFTNEHEFYLKNGFQIASNPCKWVMLNDHQTMGVMHRKLDKILLFKPLNPLFKLPSEATIDLMGFVF